MRALFAFYGLITLVGSILEISDGTIGLLGVTTSGQVDLWGGNNRPPLKSLPGAAAASMVLGSCLEATKGVQMCQSLQESTVSPVTPACSLLVRSLSGRTLVCSLPAEFTVDDLERCISEYTAVPRSAFFLTFQGKMISADKVKNMDFRGPIPVVMHGRLCGGSAIAGAWVCNVCNAGQRKVAASGEATPEIHVIMSARLVLHPPLVVKKPILRSLLEPKLLL